MQGMQRTGSGIDRSRPAFYAGIAMGILGLVTFILILMVQGDKNPSAGIIKTLMTFVYAVDIAIVLVVVLQAKLLSGRGAVATGIITLITLIVSYTLSLLLVYEILKNWDTVLVVKKIALVSELLSVIMLGLTLILLAARLGRLGRLARGNAFPALAMTAAVAALCAWSAGRGIAVYCVFQDQYKSIPGILPKLQMTFQVLGPLFVGLFFFAAALFAVRRGSASRCAKPALSAGAVTTALYAASAVLMVIFIFTKVHTDMFYGGGIYSASGLARIAMILSGLAMVSLGVTLTLLAPSFEDFRRAAEGAVPYPPQYPLQYPPQYPQQYLPQPQPYAAPYPGAFPGAAAYPGAYQPANIAQAPQPVPGSGARPAAVYPPPLSPPAEINCPACGASNPAGARFCKSCGRGFGAGPS